jgi:hypothetical protein
MEVSQSPDTIVSCLFFSLCLSVMPSITALRTLVVLACNHYRPPNFSKKTNETFDYVRRISTIIRVAPKCWDSTEITHLCHGTWLIRILTKTKERVHERGSRDGSSLAALCSMCRVGLRHWSLGIIPLEINGHTLQNNGVVSSPRCSVCHT